MKASATRAPNKRIHKTKDQLQNELEQKDSIIQQLNEQAKLCEKNLQATEEKYATLQETCQELQEKLSNAEKDAAKYWEAAEQKRQKINELEKEYQYKTKSREDELEATPEKFFQEKLKFEDEDDVSDSKSAFLLYFFKRADSYQGKIFHIISKKSRVLSGLDGEGIIRFIADFLPPLEKPALPVTESAMVREEAKAPDHVVKLSRHRPETPPDTILGQFITEEKPALPKTEPAAAGKETPAETDYTLRYKKYQPETPPDMVWGQFITAVLLQQNGSASTPEKPLSRYSPTSVLTRLHFENLPQVEWGKPNPTYEVHVAVELPSKGYEIYVNSVKHNIISGIKDYEGRIRLPMLSPGKYTLRVFATVPYAKFGARKEVDIEVKN